MPPQTQVATEAESARTLEARPGTTLPPCSPPSSYDSIWHQVRWVVAVLFAAATVFYSVVWMYYIRQGPRTTVHVTAVPSQEGPGVITAVDRGSLAANAGVRVGDRIVSINGQSVHSFEPIVTAVTRARTGDHISLGISKPDSTEIRYLDLVAEDIQPMSMSLGDRVALQLVSSFPVLFVLVGFPVLFLRIDDRNAWMLAICFAGMVASAPIVQQTGLMPKALRGFMLAYMILFFIPAPTFYYYFFATFPARSPVDQRFPWLKNVLLSGAVAVALPLAIWAMTTHSLESLWPIVEYFQKRPLNLIFGTYFFGVYGLALFSLLWNSFRSTDAEARRKTRVIVWGTTLAILPWFILQLIATTFRLEVYSLPFWIWGPVVILIFFMPLSFAYAVLRHRVLDVPVLLRRSARYLLVQRGFMILIFVLGIGATMALASSFEQHYPSRSDAAIPVGVVFGVVLVGSGTWLHQHVRARVDRAFFRSSYDSRQILENLVEKTREVRTREQLSSLLHKNLLEALHPTFLLIYFKRNEAFILWAGSNVSNAYQGLVAHAAFLDEVFRRRKPSEVTPAWEGGDTIAPGAECLVPIASSEEEPLGLLALGPRKSEEPYSGEDKRLLATIASQAGMALEHIHLGEEIAERVAAERRTAHEVELARQVQRKLFPQNPPRLTTLEYAGDCVQARVVGGDYYDFLELAPGVLGFALADISGKGFPAALLMANLQANLRGRYTLAVENLPRLLESVNRLFYENTEPSHYATMFFGCYNDRTRELRYINCGHNPPILLRADNSLERLPATATVVGLFQEWGCSSATVRMNSGDILVVYTDGVTEAADDGGEEFGEERLICALHRNRTMPATGLLGALIHDVQQFSSGEQGDDLTLVVGKGL